ncbi:glutathione-dependent formaldehyde-activating enzyme family protein [Lysobacter capsici]|uniref:GFA family protein n=1 Tax=Lysobacter capsici TaxID=435897 RepID=UPI000716566F|nr:GFA family protein [Lysobacter capsici]ALN83865.1 glutathione-dependent formaldehyde-activating enzyme family protein [Lysobacter capsici]
MTVETYQASCHCGAIRYEVDLDLSAGTSRCNCSMCNKLRKWGAIVKPDAFRLLSGGPEDTGTYQFGTFSGTYHFCKHCAVHAYGTGELEVLGGKYYSINIACLDVHHAVLAAAPVQYMDGLNNDWFNVPKITSHM